MFTLVDCAKDGMVQLIGTCELQDLTFIYHMVEPDAPSVQLEQQKLSSNKWADTDTVLKHFTIFAVCLSFYHVWLERFCG
jgi:hypothetical protein